MDSTRRSPRPPPAKAAGVAPGLRLLDPAKILDTTEILERRVRARFPAANLTSVAASLVTTSREATLEAGALARPMIWLRAVSALVITGLLAVAITVLTVFRPKEVLYSSVADYFQGLDAAVNETVLIGAAIYFLLGLENRLKRRRALASLHGLRSLAHIIDMHQLTKDPDGVLKDRPDTEVSPAHTLTAFELTRYLDYCAEMLALLSKVAALHVQRFDDPVTLSAVNDIENLTSDLSRKIWQKIMILDRLTPHP